MRFTLLPTLLAFGLGVCQAQSLTPSATATPVQAGQSARAESSPAGTVEKRTERIQVEDDGARIDELRVGGETRSIDVQPKNGMPTYQVQPASGERSWKILGF